MVLCNLVSLELCQRPTVIDPTRENVLILGRRNETKQFSVAQNTSSPSSSTLVFPPETSLTDIKLFSPHFLVNDVFLSYFFLSFRVGYLRTFIGILRPFCSATPATPDILSAPYYTKPVPALESLYRPFLLLGTLCPHTSTRPLLSFSSVSAPQRGPSTTTFPTHTLHVLALLPPPLGSHPP